MKKPKAHYKAIIMTALGGLPELPELQLLNRDTGYNIPVEVEKAPALIDKIKNLLTGYPMAVMLRGPAGAEEIVIRPVIEGMW